MKNINKELLKSLTVLYVEDEKSIADEVEYFFKRYIDNFYCASNGKEGLELYKKINPDIIITDIQMPIMNGLDMIKEINSKTIPVIITTAFSDIDYFLKAIELNVNKFAIKPIDLIELVNFIQECVYTNDLQNKLFEKENLLEIIDENVLITITNEKGIILNASKAFCRLTQYDKTELIGKTQKHLRHEYMPESFYENMWKELEEGKIFSAEVKNKKKNGEEYWVSMTVTPVYKNEKIINYTWIRQDITNKKKLEKLALEDDLTKLYNRRYLNITLDRELRRIKRDDSTIGMMMLDVDYFKKYNDTYGHPKGDDVLKEIAQVLISSTNRASDYAFRIGGEEFCILFSDLDIKDSINYANSVIEQIEELNIVHEKNAVSSFVTVSAGLVIEKAQNIKDITQLYQHADEALYQAKSNGRNQIKRYIS